MIRRVRTLIRAEAPLLAALLACLLVFRAALPVLSAPAEGLVPLCKDGRIVWVSLDGAGAVLPADEETGAPCPWFGLGPALAADAPEAPAAPQPAPLRFAAAERAAPALAAPLPYRSRAPPLTA